MNRGDRLLQGRGSDPGCFCRLFRRRAVCAAAGLGHGPHAPIGGRVGLAGTSDEPRGVMGLSPAPTHRLCPDCGSIHRLGFLSPSLVGGASSEYQGDDVQYLQWQRLNHRTGIALGLAVGAAHFVVLGLIVYVFGYLAVQVSSEESNSTLLRPWARAAPTSSPAGLIDSWRRSTRRPRVSMRPPTWSV